ncbi:protein mono-ADP-ribosyltransferase TIPARP-like isoform X2 [Platichthys flesus]|uniref:protein mono-ADP-ribosyltransferase TIPARP-like isoform X2 n=1 Tax=Platichthys flesus TaxID=8260 RepID=UPI002DB6743A|nr:protein mono-ADP-ribosyltransferase TIPARP-like isoform X2 [Platichthys flesus]
MADVSSGRGVKRNMASDVVPPPSNSSQVTLLSPSLLLLGIPPDTDTSLPVWDAVRSQRVHVTWSVNAYSVGVRLTPATSDRARDASSGGREGASIAAWTSALSLTTQQQSDASQCPPSALLTFSQTGTHVSPCPPQMIPPNPTTSLIVPLPLIISQRQPPRQPGAKTRKLAVIRTPAPAPPRPPAPPKPPVPCPFHTRSSSDVDICDRFLLGLCRAGGRCRKHHTPFPYHWQLMCSLTDMWVSISPRFQVLLERSYCDAAQEVVSIEDGHVSCTVFFESMELDELSRYGGVRRLSNSDRNPYFPSRWKIYWLNDSGWEEYKKDVSELLMKTVAELEPECSFFMGLQEYKLDFTTMTQTHVSTGLQREVRCRPVFRSPESMQPYLQTGILLEPTRPAGDLPGANFSVDPLEEFSSWYPPVWCLAPEEEFSLVDVPAGTQTHHKVCDFFYQSLLETKVEVVSIQQVQNLLHWDKYQRHKTDMQRQHTSTEPLERHLFHGTTREAAEDICHNNFDPRVSGVNGTTYGCGSYFATAATLSHGYSAKAGPGQVRHMFLAKVLVGKASVGRSNYRRPPPLSPRTKHLRYDTCVDNRDNPTLFVVFDSCQCYPYYLIKYQDVPQDVPM